MAAQFAELENSCKKTVEHFRKELSRLRTGRASTSLFEGLMVEYYGSPVPLQQLALVNAPEPRLVTIQVYDPAAVESVEKAILSSDLGLNPARDGSLLRINIPHLTEERRKELVKRIHKMGEETKIAVRNHRHEAIDLVKKREKAKEMSQDEARRAQEEIQKITDRFNKEIDSIVSAKEKEMLEV